MHKGGSDDTLLAIERPNDLGRELGTRIGHGEGCGAGTVLGLDDLIAAILDAVRKFLKIALREAGGQWCRGLRQKWDDLSWKTINQSGRRGACVGRYAL